MGRSRETYNKKEVRKKKEKKRKDKAEKQAARKEGEKKTSFDDMIAYVDEFGNITSTPPDPSQKEETEIEDIEISVPRNATPHVPEDRQGVITNFNASKGFGFIRDQTTKDSLFFHLSNTIDRVDEGDKVTYLVEKGPKGLVAVQVKLVK